MDSVENVVPGASGEVAAEMATVSEEDTRDQQEMFSEPGTVPEALPTNGKEPKPEAEPAAPAVAVAMESQADGQELMANGLKFFSQLAQTLSDKEATAKLVSSITERDEATGQTYLKVPVENEKTVESAITMLGTLFKALQ